MDTLPEEKREFLDYTQTLQLSTENIASQFKWAGHSSDSINFIDFCETKKSNLNLNPNLIITDLDQAHTIALNVFNKMNNQLPYHNETHTQITAVIAAEIFLGKLAIMTDDPKYKTYLESNNLAQRLTTALIFIASVHEVDDWWKLGCTSNQLKNAKELIAQNISSFGMGADDFNKLIIIDDFIKPLDTVIDNEIMANNIDKPFFDGETNSLLLDSLPEGDDFKRKVLTIFGQSLRAADFMQIFDPAYLQFVELIDEQGKVMGTKSMGPATLAIEMKEVRPQALKPFSWANDDGSINWENVGIGKYFVENIARPNIESGFDGLEKFSPTQFNNAADKWKETKALAS